MEPQRRAITRVTGVQFDAKASYMGPYGLPATESPLKVGEVADDCEVKIVKPDPRLFDADRDVLFAIGVVWNDLLPVVSAVTQHNMLLAITNRQCGPVPLPDADAFERAVQRFFDSLPPFTAGVDPEDYAHWNSRFPPSRRAQHDAAVARLLDTGVDRHHIDKRASFTKTEKLFKDEPHIPRCITGATDAWNVLCGPWFLALAARLHDIFNGGEDHGTGLATPSRILFASAITAEFLGRWYARAVASEEPQVAVCGDDILAAFTYGGVRYMLEVDGKHHDAHMHSGFHAAKWRLYAMVDPDGCRGEAQVAAREAQRMTLGEGLGVRYKHPYRVRSGDWDTKDGNCVSAAIVALHLVAALVDATWVDVHAASAIAVAAALELGYTAKVRVLRVDGDGSCPRATFLSGCFYPVDGIFVWGPKPGKLVARLGWLATPPTRRTAATHAGTLTSFVNYSFVPFLRVYVQVELAAFLRVCKAARAPHAFDRVLRVQAGRDPADDTWRFFFARYGVTEADERDFRRQLVAVEQRPYMLESRVLASMREIDG